MEKKVLIGAVAILILACGRTAFADGLLPPGSSDDPSTLHVGPGVGTTCAQGCAGDPNLLPPSGSPFDLYQNQGGSGGLLNNPVFIIIGVPNDSSASAPTTFTSTTLYTPFSAATGTPVPSSFIGFGGSVTPGTNAYTVLGVNVNSSESFTNWNGFDSSVLGLSGINSFGLYVYEVSTASFGAMDLINVTDSGLPVGSFVIGYGVNSQGQMFGTPFTEAGAVVPEPASLSLVGLGLVALGSKLRRKQSKQTTAAPAQTC